VMRIKRSANDRVYDLGSLIDPAEHVGLPVAEIGMQPIPLSRREMVAALSLAVALTAEDLGEMTVAEVGLTIAEAVLYDGLRAVRRAAERDRDADCSSDEVLSGFLSACARRVDELLTGRAAPAAAVEAVNGGDVVAGPPVGGRLLVAAGVPGRVDDAAAGW
jgi:hypothetical protein